MMHVPVNFAFEENLVRVVEIEGEPWFVGVDVCRALGLVKPENALSSLDDDESYTLSKGVSNGLDGPDARLVVSEPGVFRLVFRSRKPEAERFKRWLAHDVLPQIRKTGQYRPEGDAEPLPDLDSSSVQVWRTRLDMVREARIQFGPARARLLWSKLGLTPVPELTPRLEGPSNDWRDCLEHLLSVPIEAWKDGEHGTIQELLEAIDRDAITLTQARETLAQVEIGLMDKGFTGPSWTLCVPNFGNRIGRLFRDTEWAGRWRQALRQGPPHIVMFDKSRNSKLIAGRYVRCTLIDMDGWRNWIRE
ncbi:BRO family protein [Hoeflea sp. CAU 1731]